MLDGHINGLPNYRVTLVNCTGGHPITMLEDDGSITVIPHSGANARREITKEVICYLNGKTFTRTTLGEVLDLPEKRNSVLLIVSRLVYDAIKYVRDDLICVGDIFKDDKNCKFIRGWTGDYIPLYGGIMEDQSEICNPYLSAVEIAMGVQGGANELNPYCYDTLQEWLKEVRYWGRDGDEDILTNSDTPFTPREWAMARQEAMPKLLDWWKDVQENKRPPLIQNAELWKNSLAMAVMDANIGMMHWSGLSAPEEHGDEGNQSFCIAPPEKYDGDGVE